MLKTLISVLFFMCITSVYAQSDDHFFALEGTINADSGKMCLCTQTDTAYYPDTKEMEVTVVHGRFRFTGHVAYPTLYYLMLRAGGETKYISGTFYVESGTQAVACNIDSARSVPGIENNTMMQWRDNFLPLFDPVKRAYNQTAGTWDSLRARYKKNIPADISAVMNSRSDSLNKEWNRVMYEYTQTHHESYIVLWALTKNLARGYIPLFDSIFNELAPDIRNTPTGLELAKKLRAAKTISIGSAFPKLDLYDIGDNPIQLAKFNKHKYTLVDFWFSHCGPCKKQFPIFKKLYDQYNGKGFEIIGISNDQEQYLPDWKKIIKDGELSWPQYLDKGRTIADELSIEFYPTNFLLDEHGVIIKRNVTTEELTTILAKLDMAQ